MPAAATTMLEPGDRARAALRPGGPTLGAVPIRLPVLDLESYRRPLMSYARRALRNAAEIGRAHV